MSFNMQTLLAKKRQTEEQELFPLEALFYLLAANNYTSYPNGLFHHYGQNFELLAEWLGPFEPVPIPASIPSLDGWWDCTNWTIDKVARHLNVESRVLFYYLARRKLDGF